MRKFLARMLPISFLVAVMFVSIFSTSAFASSAKSLGPLTLTLTPTTIVCNPTEQISHYKTSQTGNACSSGWFDYQLFPASKPAVQNWWTDNGIPTSGTIISCNIDAWFPNGSASTDTRTRYDFWYGNQWLGWVGHPLNQNTAPAGWNRIATNLGVNNSGQQVAVTVQDDGGSGNLAYAAMRFICTYVTG